MPNFAPWCGVCVGGGGGWRVGVAGRQRRGEGRKEGEREMDSVAKVREIVGQHEEKGTSEEA